tara:strand:- start:330 stop:869 length:540 start_codon:yes stop_codon:yes gene_type:complete
MNKRLIVLMLALFLLGWFSHTGFSLVIPSSENSVFDIFKPNTSSQLQQVFYESLFQIPEKPSPADRIKEDQIIVTKDQVIINLENAQWAKFTDTNSMDPVLDQGTNAIEITPESANDLQAGDIISYISNQAEGIIIHRIVEIGNDGSWFARVKGDNIDFEDPGKIRFNQIQRVVVGILY